MDSHNFKIGGMCCNHCDTKIKKALTQVNGVSEVDIDRDTSEASIRGNFDASTVEQVVMNLGYQVLR